MGDAPLSLRDLGYVILFCKDVVGCAAFYRDQLGIPVRFGDPEWTELDTVGPTLALHRHDQPPPSTNSSPIVTFKVDDVRAGHAALAARGVAVGPLRKVHDAGPMVGVAAEFKDPEGNRLSLYGLVPAATWSE